MAGRLQRYFGVSRIKIDPNLTGLGNNPEAQITMEQQISRDITFTYVTSLAPQLLLDALNFIVDFHRDDTVLEFFEVPFPQEAYRTAILRYADFGLELLGGSPVDFDKFRAVLEAEAPEAPMSTMRG